jgi:hypothetical protein
MASTTTAPLRELARQAGAKALVALGTRVEAWASESQMPTPVSESIVDTSYGTSNPLWADDLGWMPMAMGELQYNTADLPPVDRIANVRRARVYYVRDAYSKQAIRLHTVYCVGRGLSIKARDYRPDPGLDEKMDDPENIGSDEADVLSSASQALQDEADAFWEHPDNDSVFSSEAQSRLSDRLNVDGELFYVFLPADQVGDDENSEDDKVMRVRVISDCLQITRIIKNPEDDSEVWYYLRASWEKGSVKQRIYPDYRLYFSRMQPDGTVKLPNVRQGLDGWSVTGGDLDGVEVMFGQYIYHQKVNTIGDRGNSLLTPAMDWAKVNRNYLEDRATISKAHAKIAWKRMIKGPASAVANFGKKNLSGNSAVSGVPLPSVAGQTLNVNSSADLEPINAQDGGKNAYVESRNFRLMFYAAVGFGEHYFGDGSMGTRATSTQMERPTELTLQAFQHILKSGYEVMFAFHLASSGRDYDAHAVWVDAPPILENDMQSTITAILSVIGVLPQFDIDEIILKMLQAFGVDDPQDVLIKIRERQKELYLQNLQLAAITSGLADAQAGMATSDPNVPDAHAANQGKLLQAQAKYIAMVTPSSDPTKEPGPKIGPQFAQPGTKGGALVMRKPTPSKLRPNSAATP